MRRVISSCVLALLLVLASATAALAYPQVRNLTLAPTLIDCVLCHGGEPVGGPKGPHGSYSSSTKRCKSCHWSAHDAASDDLLFQETPTKLCRACHDGSGGVGIYTLSSRGLTPGSAHRIEATSTVPGGSESGGPATVAFLGSGGKLGCDDCHSPHDSKTVQPFTHARIRFGGNSQMLSSALLRQKPGNATTAVTEYGSDWCLGCHKGRNSGGMVQNHPVDSRTTHADPFTYERLLQGGLPAPTPIALSADGSQVYVADVGNHRIVQFTSDGTFVRQWATQSNGQLTGLALTKDINGDGQRDLMSTDIGETDAVNSQFRYWKTDGTPIGAGYQIIGKPLGITDTRAGNKAAAIADTNVMSLLWGFGWTSYSNNIGRCYGIAVDPGGMVYLADATWSRITAINSAQAYWPISYSFPAGTPPVPGSGPGQMREPLALALDPGGKLWVADTGNDRVQRFTAAGTYEYTLGGSGSGPGQFARPTGIAIANDGTIYVADSGNHRIQKFTAAGTFVRAFGSPGSGAGQLALEYSVRKTMAGTNQGFLMVDPRMAGQTGHGPICQQCHSDARDPGSIESGVASATVYSSFNGYGAGNPTYQCFPHEASTPRLLVETGDGLCLNCHLPTKLP